MSTSSQSTHGILRQDKNLARQRVLWLDLIKAIALLWIFLTHVVEQIFGYPYIGNPATGWPPLAERVAQLHPLEGFGLWGIPVNLIRYLGWTGDQGVNLFLIVSGFGLTWGLLAKHGKAGLPLGSFYLRRAQRIYPLWWGVHLLFIGLWLLTGWGLSITNPATYLSMIGIRITPELLYYFSPAWWYVGLLVQLYLVYPLLWAGLRKFGPLWLLIVSCAIAFSARALGLLVFDEYLDAWARGAIFITRLPEFVFGVSLAAWMYYSPDRTENRLRAPSTLVMALVVYVTGLALSLTLLGMTIAPFLLGVGMFVMLYAALSGIRQPAGLGLWLGMWTGNHSYSLYLMHHPFILILVPVGLTASGLRTLAGIAAAVMLTVAGAMVLEWAVSGVTTILGGWRKTVGLGRTVGRVAALGIAIGMLLIGGELLVRWADPQEVYGWGERPSLEPNPTFGWRLKPDSETRLRWDSYDYYVTVNSLGFPGPEYSEQKAPNTFRILTVGDAFTSAEGVNTEQAWPRLLETKLAAQLPDRNIEVLNFGITGYGPNQYASILKTFVPEYQPDLVIVGFYVNEYFDVLSDNEEFQQSIGFNQPAQNSWLAIVSLSHLRKYTQLQVVDPLKERLRGTPRPQGYFLGGFAALERNQADMNGTGRQLVAERLEQMKTIADEGGAKVVIAMIPAPVQVCRPEDLAYYPQVINLQDSSRFDLDQPQRLTQELADSVGLISYDLRPPLDSVAECPYQPRNIHWTTSGHQVVAAYLSDILLKNGNIQ